MHAQRLGQSRVDPEHLFLGLLEDPVVAVLLTGHVTTPERIRSRLVPILGFEPRREPLTSCRYGRRLREAMAFAEEERIGFGHQALSPGHLLLGLIKEERGVSGRILAECGATLDDMRKRVLECLAAMYPE
jgi:ATP-dependent Clp protease ATP-binding subunit ClpC